MLLRKQGFGYLCTWSRRAYHTLQCYLMLWQGSTLRIHALLQHLISCCGAHEAQCHTKTLLREVGTANWGFFFHQFASLTNVCLSLENRVNHRKPNSWGWSASSWILGASCNSSAPAAYKTEFQQLISKIISADFVWPLSQARGWF